MRTLNVRRLIVLLVVVSVLAGSTHLLHSFQIQRKSSTFKTQAKAAWDDNPRRERDALYMMVKYLSLEPRDLDARQDLGFWNVDLGHFSAASPILEEVVRSLEKQTPPGVPPSPEMTARLQSVRRKLIIAAKNLGRLTDALDHLRILHQELPQDVGILDAMGSCLISLGKEDEAIKSFSQAVALDPQRVDIYNRMALALRFPKTGLPNQVEAEKCMAEMIAYWDRPCVVPSSKGKGNGPKTGRDEALAPLGQKYRIVTDEGQDKGLSANAHQVYGVWLSQLGKHAEALKQAKTALALKKDHPGALLLAGQSELALKHFSDAEIYARRGIAASPQEYAMYSLRADILVANNHRDQAIEDLKQAVDAIQSKSDKANLLWNLANLYLDGSGNKVDARNVADAVDCMKRMREYKFSPVRIAFLEARVQYANEDWKSAREGFDLVRKSLNESPQLMECLDYWTGYCCRQQGNPDQAMVHFRNALGADRSYFKARDGVAQIFLANGDYRNAIVEYQDAVKFNPADFDAWLALGRTLLLWNQHRAAGSAGATGQNWNQVETALQRAGQLKPLDVQVPLLFAEVYLAEGRAAEADRLLKEIHPLLPPSAELCVAQANLAAREGHPDQAQQILLDGKAKFGDKVPFRLVQSASLVRELGTGAGPEIENLSTAVDAFNSDEKTRLWNGLLSNLLEIREYDRAMRIGKLIAREQPHDAMIRYRLLELALSTFDARDPVPSLALLDGELDEIDRIAGQGPLWLYGKAVRLMLESQQGKPELLDAALNYADSAQKARVNWSRPDVLKGLICEQRGDKEKALYWYQQASINGDRDLELTRRLLKMLYQRQRYDEANQVIKKLDSSQTPLDSDIISTVAQISIRWGDFSQALDAILKGYDPKSDDYSEHLLHGQLLTRLARKAQGHQDKLPQIKAEGEKSLRRAIEIDRNAPEARVMLVQFLIATNNVAEARKAAADAEDMIPVASAPLAMGYVYEALGEMQKARQKYEKAVQLNPDSPGAIRLLAEFYVRNKNTKLASPLIERLLSGDVPSSKNHLTVGQSDLIAARRMKANVMFASVLAGEGYSQLAEAIGLIDQNLAAQPASVEDKRLKIRFLCHDLSRARGPDVLDLSESLVHTGGAEPDPEDRYVLASLYLARGNGKSCLEQMQKLVNGNQSSPRYVSAYVRMLLDQDELPDANSWLERLKPLYSATGKGGKPAETVGFEVELLFRKKEWGKVPDFLAEFVRQGGEQGAGSKEQVSAPPAPSSDLLAARSLLAARLLEDFGGRLTAPAQQKMQQGFYDKALQWYESYIQKRPGSEMLLAGFHARRGHIAAAIELMERFAAKAPPGDLGVAAAAAIRSEKITPQQLRQVEKVLSAALPLKRSVPLLDALKDLKIAQGDFAAAEDLCRQTIAADPNNYPAYNNLGVLLAYSGNKPDEALAMVDRAINMVGPLPALLDSRAVVHMARNEARQALEDLRPITTDKISTNKIDPLWLFHKARALFMANEINDAAAALAAAQNKGLDRSLVDPPERPLFDQLVEQLAKRDEQHN